MIVSAANSLLKVTLTLWRNIRYYWQRGNLCLLAGNLLIYIDNKTQL